MQNKLLNFIREEHLIAPEDTIICAVSGGADSVALLFALYLLKDKLNIRLEAAHFNHISGERNPGGMKISSGTSAPGTRFPSMWVGNRCSPERRGWKLPPGTQGMPTYSPWTAKSPRPIPPTTTPKPCCCT